jgi:hypothetical protein
MLPRGTAFRFSKLSFVCMSSFPHLP